MQNKKNLKIVFFGTPEFAVASLERLLNDGHDIAAVVTMPDKVAGRGHKLLQSDVKKCALAHGLPILQPTNLKDAAFTEELRAIGADLFIVIAFRMLPESVWAMPPLGTFNLHASLLPRYRGAAPINRAIMNGDTETGITTFFLRHEIDTGDIIQQCRVDILPEDNAGTVHDRLMQLGADMVADTVKAISEGTVTTSPQPQGEFIPAPKIFKEDCHIDWTRPAHDIHNQIRGLSPYPAAWTEIRNTGGELLTVKVFESRLTDRHGLKPGEISTEGKSLIVGCGDDSALVILSLQPAGKRRMETEAFLLGYHPEAFV
ncbi:MAG: methionyl-tRNA formyltransferase [Muribaculaceae bacterium]|nr:methionyl-tRNA formyltransferase [Muribaculaceae bacterium]MDE7189407.1 methionyl-tRNA formyltransferase [Muribaculaceae bacterium]